jgi:hypothetical protein
LVKSLVGYNGEVMSDSNDYARCEKVLRELEKKYYLTQVISSKQAKERSMTSLQELDHCLKRKMVIFFIRLQSL